MSPSKDTDVALALVIGVVFIMVIVVAILFFVPLKDFNIQDDASVDVQGEVRTLDLKVDAEISDVQVVFQDLSDKEMLVTFSAEGRVAWYRGAPDIVFDVSYQVAGLALTVDVTVDQETGAAIKYENTHLVVYVDPSLSSSLDIEVKVGEISLDTLPGVELRDVSLNSDVGSLTVELEQGTVLTEDLRMVCRVGSVDLMTNDLVLDDDVNLEVEIDVGSVEVTMEQIEEMRHNLTVECRTNVGSVKMTLDIHGDIGAEMTSSASVGSIDVEETGFSGPDAHLVSDNFPDRSNFVMFLETDVGSIDINAEWRD
ncbi:MAG: hypothetical protein MIO90_05110 [Methanomassiliicoccales archaeon]|nr:hypothetical protein [Methanomassiliicoccales archaeon]